MAQSPFPGMDPYLESLDIWPDLHARLANIFAEQLSPLLAPKYVAELYSQVVIDRIIDEPPERAEHFLPDVTVSHLTRGKLAEVAELPYTAAPLRLSVPMAVPTRLVTVYVRHTETKKLVTVIEILSPVNKRAGNGRHDYLEKRATYLETGVHLVEIDFLRKWQRMPLEGRIPPCDYLIMMSDAYERPRCDVWPITLRQSLPTLRIPLIQPDPPVTLDLSQALQTAYKRARYDLRIDYNQPPNPPLPPEDEVWAAELIHNEARKTN